MDKDYKDFVERMGSFDDELDLNGPKDSENFDKSHFSESRPKRSVSLKSERRKTKY